jgi:hypothetical protein
VRTVRNSSSWFERLRRERGLFALVGALLLVLNTFQPLAQAASTRAGGWIICHGFVAEADKGGAPDAPQRDCPICIAGACASVSAPAKALLPLGPAFMAPVLEPVSPERELVRTHLDARAGPPSGIRAPPFDI